MIAWMQKTFGTTNNPKYMHRHLDDYQGVDNQYGNGFKNDLQGKKDIFSMLPIDPLSFRATGHVDIFDGITCKAGCYFQDVLEFHFWKLK